MPFALENLQVYQKTLDFADHVLAATHEDLRERLEELGRMLSGLINGLDRRPT